MAKDAIAFFQKEISQLTWKTSKIVEKHVKKARTVLASMVRRNLKVRSGALASAVKTGTIKTTSGTMIMSELRMNPAIKNPRGFAAVLYADTQMGTGKKTINSKGKRLAVPFLKGPAYEGKVQMYQPSTFPGHISRITSILLTMGGKRKGAFDLIPTWVLKDSVTIPRRVNPQEAADKVRLDFLYDISKLIGSQGLSY